MRRRRDPCIGKLKAVLRAVALGLGSKTRVVERPIEEVAGTISGEHTSSPIRAMRTGRQTKNQQPRRSITEGRYGFTPVLPIEISPAFCYGNFAAVVDQAGAALAGHYLAVQRDRVSGAKH